MILKVGLLLFLLFFAFATTALTLVPKTSDPNALKTMKTGYLVGSGQVDPTGDEVDRETAPM